MTLYSIALFLHIVGALVLVGVRIVQRGAELAHSLAHGACRVGQPGRPENEQRDDAHDQQLEWSYLEHDTESRPA